MVVPDRILVPLGSIDLVLCEALLALRALPTCCSLLAPPKFDQSLFQHRTVLSCLHSASSITASNIYDPFLLSRRLLSKAERGRPKADRAKRL